MCSTVAANTAFIDISTFTALEAYIYGGPASINWFLASFQKSNWFSFIPISVRHTGVFDFGQSSAVATFNRSADYILNVWFRCVLPQIMLNPLRTGTAIPNFPVLNTDATLRYTNFPMHNLFESIQIQFNELSVQKFSSAWLDNRFMFTTDAAKRLGYRNMIGDIDAFVGPKLQGDPVGHGGYLNLPLPFFFAEDSGVALPMTALPYNDVRITYTIRPFSQLIVIDPGTITTPVGAPGPTRNPTLADVVLVGTATTTLVSGVPVTTYASGGTNFRLIDPCTFVHAAVVHEDERAKIGQCPRDILIFQIQEAQQAPLRNLDATITFDLRFSYAIVALFFSVRNDTIFSVSGSITPPYPAPYNNSVTAGQFGRDWSNYTTNVDKNIGFDPIDTATLYYDNTQRFSMGADYFSTVAPWYWCKAIPEDTGYHIYSYALHPFDLLTPSGSTNYSKLANVSIAYEMSPVAHLASQNPPLDINQFTTITYGGVNAIYKGTHILLALSLNLLRFAGGSVGFPSL